MLQPKLMSAGPSCVTSIPRFMEGRWGTWHSIHRVRWL